mgnify:CR=1 FL=1|jgi:hypothetical protein
MRLYVACFIIFLCILYICNFYSGQVAYVHDSGRVYYINNCRSEEEKKRKVEALHQLYLKSMKLFEHLKTHNTPGCVMLLKKYKFLKLQIEELPNGMPNVFAYNVNKGDKISICLSKENTLNELFFVILHELSHGMTTEYSHNEEFWTNFKYLIKVADENNLYVNKNYAAQPIPFCKHTLNHNPTF